MIRKKTACLFLCLFSLSPVVLLAQKTVTVKPGSPIMNGVFIEPYTNKWQVSIIDTSGTKKVIRIWTDYLQILKLNNSKYLHRVQDLYDANYKWGESWINIVEAENLVPLRYTLHGTDGRQSIMQFNDKDLRQQQIRDGVLSDTTFNLAEQVFDWNLYGMLLVGLPFEIGITYKLPVWSEGTNKIDYLLATVDRQTNIQSLSGEEFSTYKISTNKRLIFWLSKTKPYVIQLELNMQNGSTMIWEML